MESTLIEFDEKVAEIKDQVDQLKDYIGGRVIVKSGVCPSGSVPD